MAANKEIKVRLSLDDAGFSSKIKEATEVVDSLRGELTNFGTSVAKMDSTMSAMSKNMDSFMSDFSGLGKQLGAVSSQLSNTAERIGQMGDRSKGAAGGINALAEASKRAASVSNTKWLDKYNSDLKSLAPALRQTVSGIIELDRANIASAASGKKALEATTANKLKALEIEQESNQKIINERKALVEELFILQQKLDQRGAMTSALGKKKYRGKNINIPKATAIQDEANDLKKSAELTREEMSAVQSVVRELEYKNAEIAKSIGVTTAEIKATELLIQAEKEHAAQQKEAGIAARAAAKEEQNAIQETQRIQKEADRAAKAAAKEEQEAVKETQRIKKEEAKAAAREEQDAIKETQRIQKEADNAAVESSRQAAREKRDQLQQSLQAEREHAKMIADMWKGMAQTYAGAKIEAGLGASVNKAAEMETTSVAVSTLNLPKDQEEYVYTSSEALSKQLKFISNLDAIKARMSAISSLGGNDVDVIDKTLATAVKVNNNLATMGFSHGDEQLSLRNMYGVAEMRQQTGDAQAMNRTFDLQQKIVTGTQGKVQVNDIETVLRKMGAGASTLSDHGLVNMAGLIDQFKVAGGDGGGGGGVATVGTIIKMLQAYATGKGKSNEAVKEFGGANILETSGMNLSQDGAHILADAKHSNFKNVDLWLKDPVAAIQQMVPQIIEYTQKSDNYQKFYKGKDPENEENQKQAVTEYLQRLGITQTAVQAVLSVGTQSAKARNDKQSATIDGSENSDQVNERLEKTYTRKLQEVDKSFDNLKISIGNQLLPIMKDLLDIANRVAQAFTRVAEGNPAATRFLVISAAVGGAVLSLKGFMSMFGAASKVTDVLRALVVPSRLAPDLEAAAVSGKRFLGVFDTASVNQSFGQIGKISPIVKKESEALLDFSAVATRESEVASKGFTAMAESLALSGAKMVTWFARIGTAMMSMIPILAQLATFWLLTDWIANLEVGGATIGHWVVGFCDRLVTGFKNAWLEIKEIFQSGAEAALTEAEIDKNRGSLNNRLVANGMGDKPKEKASGPRNLAELDEQDEREEKAADQKRIDDIKKASNEKAKAIADGKEKERQAALVQGISSAGTHESGRMNPLDAALAEKAASIAELKVKMNSLLKGGEELKDITARAALEIQGKYEAGKYDKNVKGQSAEKNHELSSSDQAKLQLLKDRRAEEMLSQETAKGLEFAEQRVAAAMEEADSAEARFDDGDNFTKKSDQLRALEREFVRLGAVITEGTVGSKKWTDVVGTAINMKSVADSDNFAADIFKKKSPKGGDGNLTHDQVAIKAVNDQFDPEKEQLDFNSERDQKAMREEKAKLDAMKESMSGAMTNSQAEDYQKSGQAAADQKALELQEDAYNKSVKAFELAEKAKQKIAQEYAEEIQKATEQPIKKLTSEWKDVTNQINNMQDQWANGFISLLEGTMTKGEGRWKQFGQKVTGYVTSILKGIEDTALKQALADPIKDVVTAGSDWLKQAMGVGTGADPAGAAGQAANTTAVVSNTTGLAAVTSAMTGLIAAITGSASTGVASGITGGASNLLTSAGSIGGDGSSLSSFSSLIMGDVFAHANGGIMTNDGPVSLRKYANGGIANSPQLALYGEAGPEAYVPLPDGRSIPVTINGGTGSGSSGSSSDVAGKQNVTVNVINQSGTSVNATQAQPTFDAQGMILNVVLTAANQPGSFRTGMQAAMK